LSGRQLRDFSARFGQLEVHVSNVYQEPGLPEVMILSNIVENGKPIGLADAGQDWHTDLSYSRTIAFANVLYAVKVPRRDGIVLGNTEFSNMHAAYDDLPADMKARLDGLTATHDFDKFWSMMVKRPGSKRAPLSAEQRQARPPVTHPVVLVHPISGRKVLYANPGYTVKINELAPDESDELLEFLFAHQLQPQYRYVHRWQEGDVLMWENFGTIHNAIADYRPDEPRLVKRCQVMATRFFDDAGAPRAAGACA
jgi:taurine dioxygenase